MGVRILHVVASDGRRGGEIFASDLTAALARAGTLEQRVAVLRTTGEGRVIFPVKTQTMGNAQPSAAVLGVVPGTLRRLREFTSSWDPHLIQAHGGEALKYCTVSNLSRSTPLIYRRIGSAPRRIAKGLRRTSYSIMIRRTARVIAVADAVRRETVELLRVPADRIVVIPNGVDAKRLSLSRTPERTRNLLRVPRDAELSLSLGALTWEKDPLSILDVVHGAMRHRQHLFHLFVGDGPLREVVGREIARRGLQNRVLMLGARADVPDLLAASDLLLSASRPDGMEGMPASVIEAGMLGRPVVAYDVAGMAEAISHGVTGLLVRSGDTDGLVAAVTAILADGNQRRSMGSAAREFCVQRFEIGTIAARYRRIYEEFEDFS